MFSNNKTHVSNTLEFTGLTGILFYFCFYFFYFFLIWVRNWDIIFFSPTECVKHGQDMLGKPHTHIKTPYCNYENKSILSFQWKKIVIKFFFSSNHCLPLTVKILQRIWERFWVLTSFLSTGERINSDYFCFQ